MAGLAGGADRLGLEGGRSGGPALDSIAAFSASTVANGPVSSASRSTGRGGAVDCSPDSSTIQCRVNICPGAYSLSMSAVSQQVYVTGGAIGVSVRTVTHPVRGGTTRQATSQALDSSMPGIVGPGGNGLSGPPGWAAGAISTVTGWLPVELTVVDGTRAEDRHGQCGRGHS